MKMKTALVLGIASLAALPSLAVELKLKWQPGKRYVVENTTNSTATMPVPGQGMVETKSAMAMTMHHEATAHEKGVRVATEFERIKLKTAMAGFDMTFDSANPGQGGLLDQVLQPLVDTKYAAVYGENGELLELQGMDKVQGAGQLGLGKDEIEAMARQSVKFVPNKNVEVGDTWDAEIDVPMGALGTDLTLVYTFKLEAVEDKDGKQIARVSMTGKAKEKAAEEGAVLNVVAKNVTGTMFFDVKLGQPVEMQTTLDLEMGLPAGVPQAEGAPGKMPVKSHSVQKLVKIEDIAAAE